MLATLIVLASIAAYVFVGMIVGRAVARNHRLRHGVYSDWELTGIYVGIFWPLGIPALGLWHLSDRCTPKIGEERRQERRRRQREQEHKLLAQEQRIRQLEAQLLND